MTLSTYDKLFSTTESQDFPRIREGLDTASIRIVHGVLGLTSELGEWNARSPGVNELEELGDLLWYTAIIADAVGTSIAELDEGRATAVTMTIDAAVAALADTVKRAVFYFTIPPADVYVSLLKSLVFALRKQATYVGLDLETVAAANIRKLAARYGDRFARHSALVRDIQRELQALEMQ